MYNRLIQAHPTYHGSFCQTTALRVKEVSKIQNKGKFFLDCLGSLAAQMWFFDFARKKWILIKRVVDVKSFKFARNL